MSVSPPHSPAALLCACTSCLQANYTCETDGACMVSIFNLDGMEHHVRTCIPKVELVPAGKPFYCLSSEDLRNTHCCYTDFCNKIDLRVPSGEWTPLLDYWRAMEVGLPLVSSFSIPPPSLCLMIGKGALGMRPEVTRAGIPPSPVCRCEDEGGGLSSEARECKLRLGQWPSRPGQQARRGKARQGSPREGLGPILEEAAPRPREGSFWRDGDGRLAGGLELQRAVTKAEEYQALPFRRCHWETEEQV